MTTRAKNIASSIVISISAIGTVLGIIVDAPEATKQLLRDAPSWLANPDVWWSVGVMVPALLLIGLIWIPWSNDDRLERFDRTIKNIKRGKSFATPEEALQYRISITMRRLSIMVEDAKNLTAVNDYLERECEFNLPEFLHQAFGKRKRDAYVDVIARTRQAGLKPFEIYTAGISHLMGMLSSRYERNQPTNSE